DFYCLILHNDSWLF
nr:immunoglobulin light chain junction region [Macaca mulatta]